MTGPFKSPGWRWLAAVALFAAVSAVAQDNGKTTIAAAADLHHAMDSLVADFDKAHPQCEMQVVYGSSGTLLTQIEQGAPFDVFFSADSDYPRQLVEHGKAGGEPAVYALGSLVLWSASLDMRGVSVADLVQPRFGRIAIANPQHAPYGKRAEQALRAAGIWDAVQSRLVYGENIAQAAQFAQSGNAQVGVLALSLAKAMQGQGTYVPVPPSLHEPLKQSFVLTRRGAGRSCAREFATYAQGEEARRILGQAGFTLPPAGAP